MVRVLFAPETFNLGETSRGVEVARRMRADGHEVIVCGYSTRFSGHVTDAGLPLELLEPRLSEADADRLLAVDQGRAVRHPFTVDMLRRRVRSELDLMDEWRPDVVVIGSTMSTFVSARAAGIPLVYVKPYAMSRGHLSSMSDFPVVAGRGRLATAANAVAGRTIRTVGQRLTYLPGAFRAVAAEHGVCLPPTTLEALDGDLNLIASLPPALEPLPLGPRDEVIGPVYSRTAGELPQEVHALTATGRPVVYVGMGSSARRDLVLAVLEAVGALDVEIVSGAGQYLTDADRRRLPRSVVMTDFIPAHRLAGLVDASVTHGGEGTVQTACVSGAPFAGIGLQAEQRWNIRQCELAGHALPFTARQLRRGELPGIVDRLLRDPRLREAARKVRDRAAAIDGPAAASRAIAALAG
ncbi:nucleotide disphospho-sugar-binding domain-containing protein [Janibacter sp. YB324]|uniref:glycosyltransferase n=1 Tax=Janibacter sp. YB324 TaxID=2761047 RepID=UPI0016254BFC|nr:nucleotide disphospho-sugar-binding domain-containing protein [Janibacter sp. YB324]QNF93505.1 glycosyltransferase [Janibacter sp. YB324]